MSPEVPQVSLLPLSTDHTVVFTPDCAQVLLRIPRNWTAELAVVANLVALSGALIGAGPPTRTTTEAQVTFAAVPDGAYTLLIGATSGPLYRAQVLVYCAALGALRELTPAVATGGRFGQASGPGPAWQAAYGRLRLALATAAAGQPAAAQALLAAILAPGPACPC